MDNLGVLAAETDFQKNPRAEKIEHAAHVPEKMSRLDMAVSACVVYDVNCGLKRNLVVCQPQPRAQVHVLVIQEKPLVETTYTVVYLPAEYHEHAGDPVGEKTLRPDLIFGNRSETKQFFQNG